MAEPQGVRAYQEQIQGLAAVPGIILDTQHPNQPLLPPPGRQDPPPHGGLPDPDPEDHGVTHEAQPVVADGSDQLLCPAPTGVATDAMRSWIERTEWARDLSAMSASQAAEVADIVVRYGVLYMIAARRIA
jgi:hypothetical protein